MNKAQLQLILRNESFGGSLFSQLDGSFLRFNKGIYNILLSYLANHTLDQPERQLLLELKSHFPLDDMNITIKYEKKLVPTTPEISQSPEFIDLSILNYCNQRCDFCYMGAEKEGTHLSLSDFHYCMEELAKNRVLQIAIGGGEPLLHPNFFELVNTIRSQYDIIPNYTTNGVLLDKQACKQSRSCGAIAVSYHPDRVQMLLKKLQLMQKYDLNTTLHVVVMKDNLSQLQKIIEPFCKAGINSIAFLLFKPTGRGSVISHQQIRSIDIPVLLDTFRYVFEFTNQYNTSIGFDSCFAPFLTHLPLPRFTYDSCTGARFIAHIDWNLDVRPCSFMNLDQGLNLKEHSLQEIWWSSWFTEFRESILNRASACQNCSNFSYCHGGCPIQPEITLCENFIK